MVRFITLLLATLQFASPGISAVADGQLARQNALQPTTHVEATTTAACPVVHHPDCGVCRYLSNAFAPPRQAAFGARFAACEIEPKAASREPRAAALAAPNGRAPPTA
jgi:hypothetical protein